MKTLQLSIIVIAGVSVISTVFFFIVFPSSQPSVLEGPQCGSFMTIIYDDPTKFNQTKILNALRENLSKDDFPDVYGQNPWWQYVSIRALDENGNVELGIPAASLQTIDMTKKTISEIDGVSRILVDISSWCY